MASSPKTSEVGLVAGLAAVPEMNGGFDTLKEVLPRPAIDIAGSFVTRQAIIRDLHRFSCLVVETRKTMKGELQDVLLRFEMGASGTCEFRLGRDQVKALIGFLNEAL